jgi:hypothetical protein
VTFIHGKRLPALGKRWGLRASEQVKFLANTVLSVVRVDRGWTEDEYRWGYTADITHSGGVGVFPTFGLFAGATLGQEDRDAFVHRIDLRSILQTGVAYVGAVWHIARLIEGYDPFAATPASEYLPAVFPTLPGRLQIPTARVLAGEASALPQIVVNGVPISPFLGPRHFTSADFYVTTTSTYFSREQKVIDWSDPPIYLPRNQALLVQLTNPPAAAGTVHFMNLWISERLPDRS